MGPTRWGWVVAVPAQSPVLAELTRRSPTGLIGGEIENLPVRIGMATAYPDLGFGHAYPNKALMIAHGMLLYPDPNYALDDSMTTLIRLWFKRCRVEYLVSSHRSFAAFGHELGRRQDPTLERLVRRDPSDQRHRVWSIIKLDDPTPEVRAARRAEIFAARTTVIGRLCVSEDRDLAMFVSADGVPARPDARLARVVSWNGSTATVEHVGACDLVIARTFDPGWLARIDNGPEKSVLPVDGGFQAVRIEGSGTHTVTLRYQPPRFMLFAVISLIALVLIADTILLAAVSSLRSPTLGRNVPGAGSTHTPRPTAWVALS
jgi:hypothetical protein